MKFSYAMLPDYPLSESLSSIQKADELGFYAVYAADETWHKDLWLLFAAAASSTSRIRLGPSISGVCLREALHLRPAGAGAPPCQDGRHARTEVVRGRRGVLRRLPPRAQLHP